MPALEDRGGGQQTFSALGGEAIINLTSPVHGQQMDQEHGDNSSSSSAASATTVTVDRMDQISAALSICSDIEILLQQKDGPSAQLDRMNNIFPSEYVCSLLSRVGCVPRGSGARERVQSGKDNGAKSQFVAIYRPKLFDLRGNRGAVEGHLARLREDVALASCSDGSSHAPLHSSGELACTLVPFMQVLNHSAMRFPQTVSLHLKALRDKAAGDSSSYTLPTNPIESEGGWGEAGSKAGTQPSEMGETIGNGAAQFISTAAGGDSPDMAIDDDPIDEDWD